MSSNSILSSRQLAGLVIFLWLPSSGYGETFGWTSWGDKIVVGYERSIAVIDKHTGEAKNCFEPTLRHDLYNNPGLMPELSDSSQITMWNDKTAVISSLSNSDNFNCRVAFDLTTGRDLWNTSCSGGIQVVGPQLFMKFEETGLENPFEIQAFEVKDESLKSYVLSQKGVYLVQDKKIGYYEGAGVKPVGQYMNEWGKGPIEAPEVFGRFLFFHQDGNAYMLAPDAKHAKEFRGAYVAGLGNGKNAYVVSPPKTISAINTNTGETDWTVDVSSLVPKIPGKVKYGAAEIQDLLVADAGLILTLRRQPEKKYTLIHDKQGRVVDSKTNPDHIRIVALKLDGGRNELLTGILDKLPADTEIRFVGYSGGARYYPPDYYESRGEEGYFRNPPQDYAAMLWDGRGVYQYLDIKTGQQVKPDLPATPVYSDGTYAYVWNENNGTLYTYRLPDWSAGKEVWKSQKADWKCSP